MIAKVFGTAAAVVPLALTVSCSHFSKNKERHANFPEQAEQFGPSRQHRRERTSRNGARAMRGAARAEREKCMAEDRGQRSDARK